MADKRISDLVELTLGNVLATHYLPIVTPEEVSIPDRNKRVTMATVEDYLMSAGPGSNISLIAGVDYYANYFAGGKALDGDLEAYCGVYGFGGVYYPFMEANDLDSGATSNLYMSPGFGIHSHSNGAGNSMYQQFDTTSPAFTQQVGAGVVTSLFQQEPTNFYMDKPLRLVQDIKCTGRVVDGTAQNSATYNTPSLRLKKATTGSTFTLTNSYITADSNVQITFASDPGITGYDSPIVVCSSGSCIITFKTAGVPGPPAAATLFDVLITN